MWTRAKRQTHIAQRLAECLPQFSLDVVGLVALYATEWRLAHSFPLDLTLQRLVKTGAAFHAHCVVTSRNELVVFAEKIHVYDATTGASLYTSEYPGLHFVSVIDATYDNEKDTVYVLASTHPKPQSHTAINFSRVLFAVQLRRPAPRVHMKYVSNLYPVCHETFSMVSHHGELYVGNSFNVAVVDRCGNLVRRMIHPLDTEFCGSFAVCLAVDPLDGSIYSTEGSRKAIRVWRANTPHSTEWLPPQPFHAARLAVLSSGHVVMLVQSGHGVSQVQLFDHSGTFLDAYWKTTTNLRMIRDGNDRIYFCDDTTMYVLEV